MSSWVNHRADGKLRFPESAVLLSVASLGVLLVSLVLPAGGFSGIDTCAFHSLTGLSCPGCGLTRAFCAISHGQYRDAWSLHPFSFPLYAAVLVGLGAPWLSHCFSAVTGRKTTVALRLGFFTLAVAMLIYGGWRAKAQFDASRVQPSSKMLSGQDLQFDGTRWQLTEPTPHNA